MSEIRQTCKVFVGGLSWETTDQRLRNYFENYGAVSEAFVSFDRITGRPRGFGFVVFEDAAVADKVVSIQHTIDRREVEAKKAVPKEDNPAGRTNSGALSQRTKKIFVGGLAQSVDDQAFRRYFEQYGTVEDAVVMYDHDNKRPRGFGFVTFANDEDVDNVFTGGSLQTLHDKPIEIKRAIPRDQIATARGRSAFSGSQTPRLEGAASGSAFGAMAGGPGFGDGAAFTNGLLHSHSLGNPATQAHYARMASAASMGGMAGSQLPLLSPDFQQNLTNSIYHALSGQFSGNLNNQLNGSLNPQLADSNGLSALQGNQLLNMARASSAHLPPVSSVHLPNVTLAQQTAALQQMGSSQLPPLGNGLPISNMGSSQLNPAKSGLLDLSGLSNGLSQSLNHSDLLAQDFNQGLQGYSRDNSAFQNNQPNGFGNNHSSPIQNHYPHESSAFASSGVNGYHTNHSSAFANNSGSAYEASSAFANGGGLPIGKQPSSLEKAFSSMALEHRPSFQETNIPAANSFEERVQMLSAGSAGLGQLPSPKLPSPYGRQNKDGNLSS